MAIVTEKYIRKPLYVEAVQVTEENFLEIAKWCQGDLYLVKDDVKIPSNAIPAGFDPSTAYIKVRVHNPKNARQGKAFVGDWLLYTDRGYKVYTQKAFKGAFDRVEEQTIAEVEQAEQAA